MSAGSKGKILVTGGCGYIGSHTVIDLIENGYEVVSIDSLIRSDEVALNRIEQVTGVLIKNHQIDLCDKQATQKAISSEGKIDGLIHFAALKSVPESVEKPLDYYRNNIVSLLNLLELCETFGIPKFVFSSSCSVYGNTTHLPVTEETPFAKAESPYAHTKQIGEQMIDAYAPKSKTQFVLLRYFNPVGAHESGFIGEDTSDVITAIVPRITGTAIGKYAEFKVFGADYPTRDGTCIRDYIHVMDIANAHTKALSFLDDYKSAAPAVFNLGTGNGVTVMEAINSFEKVSGLNLNYKKAERRSGDVVAIYADNKKAVAELGWEITRDLDTMMRTAWVWEQKMAAK